MIEADSLVYRYDSDRVLDDLSVSIPSGTFTAIAGPNGCGKTTLIHHFNGLLTPDAGNVSVDGHSPSEEPVAVRSRVGMVFQRPQDQFVAGTVGADVAFGPENLGLTRAQIDRRRTNALAAVDMDGRADERIDQLSGGEQARVAIAGALAMDPDYLILDEPFVGLDAPACQGLFDHLCELQARGTSIIVVTHDLATIWPALDRLIVMSNGRIVLDDRPDQIANRVDQYAVSTPV